ncbi:MAG: hypothetical protein BroJett013_22910 [Alphaproteobacteria bacterium]|nr:MAG: hypothetical protein BroJett013_22910 [Alphaproteobacteria bacterium]
MRFTIFKDQFATTKIDHDETWEAICAGIANAPEFPDKGACPFISLAVYGETPNENGCLRHAENVLAVSGIEGDHDAGTVSLADAAQYAREAGLRACIYSSASHTPERPRWRILVPLSQERPLSERADLMDRLNGVMRGALTPESWTRSQAFLLGRVAGVSYELVIV